MAPRQHAFVAPVVAIALAGLLATSGAACAMVLVTPLTLSFSQDEAQAGDSVRLDLAPNHEHENATRYAGSDVRVRYSWDPNENAQSDPEQPVSSEDRIEGDAGVVTLDEGSTGSLTWTIPAQADDHNVFFSVLSADGELLASGHVRVGDAPAIMAVMAGPSSGGQEPALEGGEPVDAPVEDENADAGRKDVPAPALLGALAAVGVALLVGLARRR